MMKRIFTVLVLLTTMNVFAAGEVLEFPSVKDYKDFLKHNQHVRVVDVAVLPTTSVQGSTEGVTQHKSVLIVTIEALPTRY